MPGHQDFTFLVLRATILSVFRIIFYARMQVSWLGNSAFRITTGGITVLTNPVEGSWKIPRQGADVVVSSVNSDALEDAVSGSPMMIKTPGEYEVKSVFVNGIALGSSTIYRLTVEDISIAFIGSVKLSGVANSTLELLEGSDILIVPVGGGTVASAKDAVQLISQIEPRLVIPSHYRIKGATGLDSVETFLKEYAAPHETVDKLKIVKANLPQEDTRVVVLELA